MDIDLPFPDNSQIRPTQSVLSKQATPAKRKLDDSVLPTPDPQETPTDNAALPAEETLAAPTQELQSTPNRIAESDQDAHLSFSSRVQILDLSTSNPIISYRGQVFSCTWTDVIGTNMFFAQPGMSEEVEPLRSKDNYDLLGISRIKLAGQRAKLTKKSDSIPGVGDDIANEEPAESENVPGGQDSRNETREKQVTFLEKLKEIKRRLGESYAGLAESTQEIASTPESLHESQEIQTLNESSLSDEGTLARPQEIYSQPDEDSPESTETPQTADQAHVEADETV